MIRKRNNLTLYTLLTLTVFLATSCAGKKATPEEEEMEAFKALRSNIQEVATDSARTEQVLALIGELQEEFDDIERIDRVGRLRALNLDHDASKAEFEALLNGIMQERLANHKRVTQTYRELRMVVAPEEEVTSTTGVRARLSRPLDWLVISDHAEMYGLMPQLLGGDPEILATEESERDAALRIMD